MLNITIDCLSTAEELECLEASQHIGPANKYIVTNSHTQSKRPADVAFRWAESSRSKCSACKKRLAMDLCEQCKFQIDRDTW